MLHLTDGTDFGSVDAINRVTRTVDIKKRGAQAEVHPTAVFAHTVVNTDVLADALLRIANDVITNGIFGGAQYQAARHLLSGRAANRYSCLDRILVPRAGDLFSHLSPMLTLPQFFLPIA